MLTRAEVIRMAREAGFEVGRDAGGEYVAPQYSDSVGTLVRFAALVAAAERDACAKVVENQRYAVLQAFRTYTADELVQSLKSDAKTMAKLIRTRGEKGVV